MKPQHPEVSSVADEIPTFKPIKLIGVVLVLLIIISLWLKWYTGTVSMPRYCDNPYQTIQYLEKVLREETPAADQSRRPYIVAAKLIYLIPQQSKESIPDYLQRVQTRIAEQCR